MSNVESVRKFIVETFLYGEDGKIKEDTSFLGDSIIDSTGVLELVNYLEETFHISIGDDEMIPENLDSLSNIEKYLIKKLKNGGTQ